MNLGKTFAKVTAVMALGMGGLMFSQATPAHAAKAYKTLSVKSVKKTAYHKAGNKGAFYNQTHTKKVVDLKENPYTTYYVTKQATMRNSKGNNAIYYYAKSSSGVGGWIWHSYLAKGESEFGLKYAKAAVAMDATNGDVLWQHSANSQRLVASTGKLMTIYLAVQKANKEHAWNKKISVSGSGLKAMGDSYAVGGFRFKSGHKYTFRQLYNATLIQSSNNAAIALGRWVAGSNAAFLKKMNKQADKWNLSSKTNFVSASGLENDDLSPFGYWDKGGYTDGNKISAKDLATVARHLINDYPGVLNESKITSLKTDGQTLTNENRLLKGKTFYSKSLNVDGLKTGYTPRAGLCFVGTSQKPGKHRMITVVLNDQNEFTETNELMNHVYKTANVYQ